MAQLFKVVANEKKMDNEKQLFSFHESEANFKIWLCLSKIC